MPCWALSPGLGACRTDTPQWGDISTVFLYLCFETRFWFVAQSPWTPKLPKAGLPDVYHWASHQTVLCCAKYPDVQMCVLGMVAQRPGGRSPMRSDTSHTDFSTSPVQSVLYLCLFLLLSENAPTKAAQWRKGFFLASHSRVSLSRQENDGGRYLRQVAAVCVKSGHRRPWALSLPSPCSVKDPNLLSNARHS